MHGYPRYWAASAPALVSPALRIDERCACNGKRRCSRNNGFPHGPSLRSRQNTGHGCKYNSKRPKQQVKLMLGAAAAGPSYGFVMFLYIRSPAQPRLLRFLINAAPVPSAPANCCVDVRERLPTRTRPKAWAKFCPPYGGPGRACRKISPHPLNGSGGPRSGAPTNPCDASP